MERIRYQTSSSTIAAVFLLCLLFYVLTWSGHHYSIDGVVMFQYAKALLFQNSFSMDPPVVWGDFVFVVSKWAIGLSLAYIPVVQLLAVTFFQDTPSFQQIPYQPDTPFNADLLVNEAYRASSLLHPVITALTVVILLLLARRVRLPTRQAVTAALLFGLLSPAAVYAKFDFAQPLGSLLLLLTVYLLLLTRQRGLITVGLAGLTLGLAILTRTEFLLFPTPLLIAATYFLIPQATNHDQQTRLGRRRLIGTFCLATIVGLFVLVNLWLNQVRFGAISSVGYSPTSEFSLSITHFLTAFVGNLFSPGRGILIFFPVALFSIHGFSRLYKTDRLAALVLGSIPLGLMLFYATWNDWAGGLSWGPRFLIPTLPYLALLGVHGLFSTLRGSKRKGVLALLILLCAVVTVQGVLFNPLDFFGRLQLPGDLIVAGTYNFNPQYAPLFADWQLIGQPLQWDIFWLRRLGERQEIVDWLLPTGLASIAILLLWQAWKDLQWEEVTS